MERLEGEIFECASDSTDVSVAKKSSQPSSSTQEGMDFEDGKYL